MKIDIKPLSVNKCWKGRRFKTDEYKKYEKDVRFLLGSLKIPNPPYKVFYTFGFSSASSDIDNPVKPFQDILSKEYGFNVVIVLWARLRDFKNGHVLLKSLKHPVCSLLSSGISVDEMLL